MLASNRLTPELKSDKVCTFVKRNKQMNLSAEKLDIIQRICEIQDNDLIDLIKNIVTVPNVTKSDWWNSITQEEMASINRGLDDLQQGKVQSHDQIRRKYEKWLKD
jgi:succinate dehydrogenase flavin-adding protein (antitoxin of CptAB toxin-antitoxin module)